MLTGVRVWTWYPDSIAKIFKYPSDRPVATIDCSFDGRLRTKAGAAGVRAVESVTVSQRIGRTP